MRLALLCLLLTALPARADDARELVSSFQQASHSLEKLKAEAAAEKARKERYKKKPGATFRLPNWELSALVNNKALGKDERGLKAYEKDWAKEILGDIMDLDAVRVVTAPSPTDLPMVWGNVIRIPPGYEPSKSTFLHELVHVWQYQTSGMGYLSDSFLAQACAFVTTGDRNTAYVLKIVEGKSFFDYSAEQQAEIVEAYTDSADKRKDPRYQAFIAEMRTQKVKKFSAADAVRHMESDAGLAPRDRTLPEIPGFETRFNGEAGRVPQLEVRF